MMRKKILALLCTGLIATFAAPGFSQTNISALMERPAMQAVKVDQSPDIDGDVLNDPIWSAATPVTEFWQTKPRSGEAATEKTEVRIVYTTSTFYVGVVCFDREPGQIIVADSRRDSDLDDTDSFRIILDTYLDRQNGFVFGTNPAAIEYDAQVTREGQGGGGRNSGGSASGFNLNWDAAWAVRTQTGDFGWSAEFAIPLKTLRFNDIQVQTWGINFQRNIRRRNENAYWAQLPRQFNLNRLSLAGTLTGLSLSRQRNLKLMPYTLGNAFRTQVKTTTGQNGVFNSSSATTADDLNVLTSRDNWGMDMKYSLTPSLTLDATYNTDFAQVEVDDQQINLDRFNLFFPEKRPFFLENAGLFTVGNPGEVDLFFSRRIGIAPDGSSVPILAGARISGRTGKTDVGLLSMQTEKTGSIHGNNFTVARVNRELGHRSAIGAMFINRQGTGNAAPNDDYNRAFAVNGRLGIGRYTQFTGFVAGTATGSATKTTGSDPYAYKIGGIYDSPRWRIMGNYTEVGRGFNPEVGFLRRTGGFRKPDGNIRYRYRPENKPLGLNELRPHIGYQGYWDFNGFQTSGRWHIDNHWEFITGAEVHTGMNITKEGVVSAFDISRGKNVMVPPGTYNHVEAQIVAFTSRGRWWSINTRTTVGGFFGGTRVSFRPTLRLRYGEALNTQFSLNHNNVNLPGGDFVTNLYQTRISYSFSPRILLQSLVQYNSQSDIWSANLRFSLLQAANTGLFIVYNEIHDTDLLTPTAPFDMHEERLTNRTFIIKYSLLLDAVN